MLIRISTIKDSAWIKIFSSKSSTLHLFLPDTPINSISPPQSIGGRIFFQPFELLPYLDLPTLYPFYSGFYNWATTCFFALRNYLFCLNFYSIISGNNYNNNIGNICSSCSLLLNASWPGIINKVIFVHFCNCIWFICCVIPPTTASHFWDF